MMLQPWMVEQMTAERRGALRNGTGPHRTGRRTSAARRSLPQHGRQVVGAGSAWLGHRLIVVGTRMAPQERWERSADVHLRTHGHPSA
jgi:hypothetical protein